MFFLINQNIWVWKNYSEGTRVIPIILIILPKKSSGFQLVINLNFWNTTKNTEFICGIQTFQNGRFISFEQASRERDLKDTYFSVPLHKGSKICKVSMEIKEIGQFLHLASAPRVLTKFMKVSIAILRSEDWIPS